MVDSKENYKFDLGVKVLGYKHLSWYSSFQSVGFWGGEGSQESQFHSLLFMQASIIAYNICTAKQHSKYSDKRNTFENSIIYLQYDCLLSVHVFVHEAIHHTDHNIYFNNQHVCY